MKKILAIFSFVFAALATVAVPTLTAAAASVALDSPELFKPLAITLDSFALGIPVLKFVVSEFAPQHLHKFYIGNFAYDTPFTEGLCEKIQGSLVQMFKTNAPQLKRTQVGYLDALESAQNTAGVEKVQLDQGNGKRREVRIKFLQRAVDSEILTDEPPCSGEDSPSPKEETVQAITDFVRTPVLSFDDNDMRLLCESGDEYRAGVINAQFNALAVALDKKLIADQAANFGAFVPALPPGPAYKDYALLNSTNNYSMNYKGESDLINDIENLESGAKPLVIGAGYLGDYVRQAGIGCCNQYGQNLSQAGNMDYFRDKYVDQILGSNHYITLVPGYTQLLTWNKYKGEFTMNGADYVKGTIVDPFTGLEADVKWTYDKCEEKWLMFMRLWYKVYRLNIDAFKQYDDLRGVNFSLHCRATAI